MDAKTAHAAVERVLATRPEERARMVCIAIEAGASPLEIARRLGKTRARIYQLRDEGRRLLAEDAEREVREVQANGRALRTAEGVVE